MLFLFYSALQAANQCAHLTSRLRPEQQPIAHIREFTPICCFLICEGTRTRGQVAERNREGTGGSFPPSPPYIENVGLNYKMFNCKSNRTISLQVSLHVQKATYTWLEYRFYKLMCQGCQNFWHLHTTLEEEELSWATN